MAGMTIRVGTVDEIIPPVMGTRDPLHDPGARAGTPKDGQLHMDFGFMALLNWA